MGFTEDEIEDYKEAFVLFDKEKTGAIDKTTMGTIMRALGLNPTDGEVLARPPLPMGPLRSSLSAGEITEVFNSVNGGADTIDVDKLIAAATTMQGKISGDQEAALVEVHP